MKIAREIAETWYDEDSSDSDSIGAKLSEHIAEKLMPLKWLITESRKCLPGNDMLKLRVVGDTSVGLAAFAIEKAIEMLEDSP